LLFAVVALGLGRSCAKNLGALSYIEHPLPCENVGKATCFLCISIRTVPVSRINV